MAQTRIAMFARRMSDIGVSLSLAVSIPLQLMAAASLKAFADLDKAATAAFSRIQGAGAGVKAMFMETAKAMSTRSIFDPTQIAQGMDEMVKAGFSAEQAIKNIGQVMDFAVASEQDMAKATMDLSDIMGAFRMRTGDATKDMLEMKRVSDVVVFGANAVTASAAELTEALTHQGAVAGKLAGKDLEETVAVLMSFHQAGIKGSTAGQQMMMMLRDISRAAIEHADVWEEMGMSIFDANGQMKSIPAILEMMEQKLAGANDQQRRQLLMMLELPNRSLQATMALFGLSAQVKGFEEQLRAAGGTTERVAKIQMQSFSAQLKILKNTLTVAAITIGQTMAPSVTYLAERVATLIAWFTQLNESQKQNVVLWGLVLASIGPVLVITGILIRSFGIVVAVVYMLARALVVLIARMVLVLANIARIIVMNTLQAASWIAATLASMGWAGLVVAAVAAVSIALIDLGGGFDYMAEKAGEAFDWVIEKVKETTKAMEEAVAGAGILANEKFGLDKLGAMSVPDPMAQVDAMMAMAHGTQLNPSTQQKILSSAVMRGFSTVPDMIMLGMDQYFKGFDKAEFIPGENITGDFDESLVEGFGSETGKQVANQMEPFSATELGSVEEYKARVGGQQQLITINQQLLVESKKQSQGLAKMGGDIKGLRDELSAWDLSEANV